MICSVELPWNLCSLIMFLHQAKLFMLQSFQKPPQWYNPTSKLSWTISASYTYLQNKLTAQIPDICQFFVLSLSSSLVNWSTSKWKSHIDTLIFPPPEYSLVITVKQCIKLQGSSLFMPQWKNSYCNFFWNDRIKVLHLCSILLSKTINSLPPLWLLPNCSTQRRRANRAHGNS